jgi:single-strand DNA-binding protein
MIKMTMIGYLGRDASTNEASGAKVINFSVCHTEKWKDRDGNQKEKAVWCDCSYWTEKLGLLPYLLKGTQVYLEGIPGVRHWTTKDGEIATTMTMKVLSVQLIGGRQEASQTDEDESTATPEVTATAKPVAATSTATGKRKPVTATVPDPEDDLPF